MMEVAASGLTIDGWPYWNVGRGTWCVHRESEMLKIGREPSRQLWGPFPLAPRPISPHLD